MTASLGTVKGSIAIGIGDGSPTEIGTFEAPLTATFEGDAERPGVTVQVDMKRALAEALREMADAIDPRPSLATSAVVEQDPDDETKQRLLIDGREFPWHLGVAGPTVELGGADRMTIVHLPLALGIGSHVDGISGVQS